MKPMPAPHYLVALTTCIALLCGQNVLADTLASKPLYLQSDNAIAPNLVFTFDNSGSMEWYYLTDSDWAPTDSTAFKPSVNKLYYNPEVRYLPRVDSSGNSLGNSTSRDCPILSNADTLDSIQISNYAQYGYIRYDASGEIWSISPKNYLCFYIDGSGNQINITPNTATYSRGSKRTDCTAQSNGTRQCSYAQEKQNFANWNQYYSTRAKAAQTGIGLAFAQLDASVRVGYGSLHHDQMTIDGIPTDTIEAGVRPFNSTIKSNFYNWLYAIPLGGYTPLRRAMDDVGKYYERSGTGSPWADNPATDSDSSQFKTCRQSYHILMTDGYWNVNDSRYPTEGWAKTPAARDNNDNTNGSSITNDRDNSTYQYTPVKPYKDNYENTLADVAMYYWKRDLLPYVNNKIAPTSDDPAFWQHMVNFTVSFGLSGSLPSSTPALQSTTLAAITAGTSRWPDPTDREDNQRVDDLWHAAVNSRGGFYSASDPSLFIDALTDAFAQVQARSGASSATVSNTARLSNTSRMYQASFNSGDWSGELTAFALGTDGSIGNALWRASSNIPAAASRAIYTRQTTGGNAVSFTWSNLDTSQQAALNKDAAGTTDSQGSNRLDWVRGDQSKELNRTNGLFRTRSTLLGDIINSSPVLVSNQDYGVGDAAFTSSKASRTPMLYVGANDGMLHGFRESDGVERFAYIPAETVLKLNKLTDAAYARNHIYLVDGSPKVGDAQFGSNWKTILLGSTGAGGKTVFALDITAPDSFSASNALWEYTGSDMGYTIPQPTMGLLASSDWVAIVPNGYEDARTAKLLVLNLQNGNKLKELAGDESSSSGTMNGLSTPIPVDLNGDRITDLVYAGDLLGNLWRFDLRSSQSNGWTARKIFTACTGTSCSDATRQPITARPMVITHPNGGVMVLFGTGSYFRDGDRTNTQLQTLYGVWDKLEADPAVVTKSQLIQQTIVAESTATSNAGLSVRVISNNEVNYNEKRGWYLNLMSPSLTTPVGERVISDLQLREDQLVVTTMLPSSDPCDYGGKSWLLEISPLTGSRLGYPVFDINGDGTINDSDNQSTDNGTLPVSGKSFDEIITKSSFVEKSDGKTEIKYASGSSGTIKQTLEVISPSAKGRQSWRQLQ